MSGYASANPTYPLLVTKMHTTIDTPIGPVALSWEGNTLIGVDLEPDTTHCGAEPQQAIAGQLDAYFLDGSYRFDLPIDLQGTPFQRRVWQALQEIAPGHARTYGELARELGTSPRALGGACRANPCPIVVPCHRVVAADGLGGFAGDTSGRKLAVKRWLLEHEGVDCHFQLY